jgi:hypothetical protein
MVTNASDPPPEVACTGRAVDLADYFSNEKHLADARWLGDLHALAEAFNIAARAAGVSCWDVERIFPAPIRAHTRGAITRHELLQFLEDEDQPDRTW